MDQGKVVIIGAGHVGSHCAYALATSGVCREISKRKTSPRLESQVRA